MRTTRDVWANLGMLGKAEANGENALRQHVDAAPVQSAPPARTAKGLDDPNVRVERPLVGKSSTKAAKPRVARPYPLHISVTAHAEELIRAGIAAKRMRGLRGHAASITTVVEEALETALAPLLKKG